MNLRSLIMGPVGTSVLLLSAILITVLVIRRELLPPDGQPTIEASEVRSSRTLAPWEWEAIRSGGTTLGNHESSRGTVVVFTDFQCPFCAELQPLLDTLLFREEVVVSYRHLPLEEIHPEARTAALAAECAAEYDLFHGYALALFRDQSLIGAKSWTAFAEGSGIIDSLSFANCVTSRRHEARIEQDIRLARDLGVNATPTLILNGVVISGKPSVDDLLGLDEAWPERR